MRVLMVSDVYFPRINGVSTSIETFRRTLGEQGVEVRLVVPDYGDGSAEAGSSAFPPAPVPRDPEDRRRWRAKHSATLAAARDCDLIHVQTPFLKRKTISGICTKSNFGALTVLLNKFIQ